MNKIIKVFISHKMNGLTDDEINNIRTKAIKNIKSIYKDYNIEVIDNYNHDDAPPNASRLWHLGRSIQMMAEADVIYFCKDWCKAKGCVMEYEISISYSDVYKWEIILED